MSRPHRAAAVAATLLALTGLVACGDDDKSADARTPDSATPPPVVDITATGSDGSWSFDLPSTVTGGVITLQLTNKSTSDVHDLQLVRIDGTHSPDEIKAIAKIDGSPIPDWGHATGGVGTVTPGQTGRATLRLSPGHYVFFCTSETEGTSHSEHGMFGQFDVSGDSGATEPDPTATITANEYSFETSGLQAGDNLLQFTNAGNEQHMVLAAPILPGKTLDDVKAAVTSDSQDTPPPVDFEHEVSTEVIDGGQSIFTNWNLQSGHYVLICFMTDRAGGPPHFMSGMIQDMTIP